MTKIEICGVETNNGPCTMPKGHAALWHRHRTYDGITWIVFNEAHKVLEKGVGVNGLQYAIARNRIPGITLLIEVSC